MAVEEQLADNTAQSLSVSNFQRAGQRLTISNRIVSKLAFNLKKSLSPSGNVTFTIRKVSNDSVIASKVWGDASSLPTTTDWQEVTFDSPVLVNEEVRISCEYEGATLVSIRIQGSDVKSNEVETYHNEGSWVDDANKDMAYKYTYEVYAPPVASGGGPAGLVAAGII